MKPKIIYNLGILLLFIGLLWMFLPHAFHQKIIVERHSHISDIFYGLIATLLGIAIMMYANKVDRKPY